MKPKNPKTPEEYEMRDIYNMIYSCFGTKMLVRPPKTIDDLRVIISHTSQTLDNYEKLLNEHDLVPIK